MKGMTLEYLVRYVVSAELAASAKTAVSVLANLGKPRREGWLVEQLILCDKIRRGQELNEEEQSAAYFDLSDAICRVGQDFRLQPDEIDLLRDSILGVKHVP